MTGTVYWITGLAGAGKTTLAKQLYASLRKSKETVLQLDGDILREIIGSAEYGLNQREQLAHSYAKLCKHLSSQGMDVVIATISMFHSVRSWNRLHLPLYKEIYLRVPLSVLRQRDQKQLYSAGTLVAGEDLPFEEPANPDLVLDGTCSIDHLLQITLDTCVPKTGVFS